MDLTRIQQAIADQVQFNAQKNILSDLSVSRFGFTAATVELMCHQLSFQLTGEEEELLIDFTMRKALHAFYEINQYYNFGKEEEAELKIIYKTLLDEIRQMENAGDTLLNVVMNRHYLRLQAWLKKSNPFVEAIYLSEVAEITEKVVCEQYAAEMQVELLHLENLQDPVLDLGCGTDALLVNHLRKNGSEAFGLERDAPLSEYIFRNSWFDFDFKEEAWGTIISNLGFSNHFTHHHLRSDGDYLSYARKYMEILKALKLGGKFYYAPDLPFIEEYLDPLAYIVTKTAIAETGYKATCITRIA